MKEEDMKKMCLTMYLSDLNTFLCAGNFGHGFDIAVTVEQIFHIFSCVSTSHVSNQRPGNVRDETLKQVRLPGKCIIWLFDFCSCVLLQPMLEWIESVARNMEKANKRGKLVSGVCLSACIRRIGFDRHPITPDFALLILRMLPFSVDKERSCPEYTYLCVVLPQHYRLLTA